ncbi:hypothetical protein PC9H_011781 [Pleurotus ostreatus]|uniref:Uncharacterized protein n=1 Tax=Pleurotus ostreatus TaxID=5322 RepID=A0A8H6ZM41_PLEOS|nr:uncharacterized protein PC9H_011781 [Pleurotus ostreatus]KAF7421260.1 hypothetical protein PC9H_011781 [Pleurotus ostreatus]
MSNAKGTAVKPVERLAYPTKMGYPAGGTKKEISDEELLASLVASLTDALYDARRICDNDSGITTFRRTRALVASISSALSEDPVIKQLDLEEHEQSIDGVMKELLRSCQYDWHDGLEEQGDYMSEICQEMAEWLRDIWSVLETGENLCDVRACIAYCAETVRSISNADSRAGFHHQETNICIMNEADEVIYETSQHIGETLTWFYKELLVMDAAQGNGWLTSTILADLKAFDKVEDVFELLQEPEEHWTLEMRAAAEDLIRKEQNAPRGK